MTVYRHRIKSNGVKSTLAKLIFSLIIGVLLISCVSSLNTVSTANSNPSERKVISEITTYQTALKKNDVAKHFCYNLTEYFNSFKYYKISSEVYYEKEKQNTNSMSRVTRQGNIHDVEYISSSGRYVISFSNSRFSGSDEIHTFGRMTVLGNAIRSKVYDTFFAWISKQEIALKANYNSFLFSGELNSAVEIENWYNSFINIIE